MKTCQHCLKPSSTDFCCIGCKTAYSIIHSCKLNQYYDFCKNIYSKIPNKIDTIKNNINYKEYININNDYYSIKLLIEGIQCGSCVWLIENILRQQPEVVEAHVNASTKILTISWITHTSNIDKYICLINNIGFKVIPLVESEIIKWQIKLEKTYLKTIALSGVIWLQNMMVSMGIWAGDISGELGIHTRIFMNICIAILTVPCILYSSKVFFVNAINAIKSMRSHMDIPISIAIIVTLLISIYTTWIGSTYVYFEAVSGLVFALLTGRYLELKIRTQASHYAQNLVLQKSPYVTVMRNNQLEIVSTNSVMVGEIIYIASGERIPLDGKIILGNSEVNNSILTGESTNKVVQIGDKVFAGAINILNPLRIEVESDSDNTILSEIHRLIDKSTHQKSQYQNFAARVAMLYTPIVIFLFILTVIYWLLKHHNTLKAILNGVSVLVITCPCAMGIAIPIVNIVAISNLMKKGIFVKLDNALEKLTEIQEIALDKTGVLTYGKAVLLNNIDNIKYQSLLKSIAMHSKHYLCISIAHALQHITSVDLTDIFEEQGLGLIATYGSIQVMLGRAAWCKIDNIIEDEGINSNIAITWFVVKNDKNEILEKIQLRFSDILRSEAQHFIQSIQKKFNVFIISGDSKKNVQNIAKLLNIKEFYYELMPSDKYNLIKKRKVFMIGDGLNDAAAMSIAHCSASPSNIIEISQHQSAFVFQNSLNDIVTLINVAHKAKMVSKQNIIISVIYNIISIPFAILGYASPLLSAIFMSISSIFVIINTLYKMKE